jgi:hypothetical protein
MATMTLLDMTQRILSELESDEVNSISDTVESEQVAGIIRDVYFNIIDGKKWAHLDQMFQLDAAVAATPTHMSLPSNVVEVQWVQYDKQTTNDTFDKYAEIKYKTPAEFLVLTNARHSDATNVLQVTDPSGVFLNILTDTAPTYYTSFDNENIVMDSYDIVVDTTNLQKSKSQCFGTIYPTWTHTDTATPDLPQQAFSYFLNEAKSACFLLVKQSQNAVAAVGASRQRHRMSQDNWRLFKQKGAGFPDFGRKSKK